MKIILDEYFELPIFNTIIKDSNQILSIPQETYNKFEKYMLQEEMYEELNKLHSIKNKIINIKLDDMISDKDEVEELPEGRGEAHEKCANEWYGCQMAI